MDSHKEYKIFGDIDTISQEIEEFGKDKKNYGYRSRIFPSPIPEKFLLLREEREFSWKIIRLGNNVTVGRIKIRIITEGQTLLIAESTTNPGQDLIIPVEDYIKDLYLRFSRLNLLTSAEVATSIAPKISQSMDIIHEEGTDEKPESSGSDRVGKPGQKPTDEEVEERLATLAKRYSVRGKQKVRIKSIELWEKITRLLKEGFTTEIITKRLSISEEKYKYHKNRMRETGWWKDHQLPDKL